LTAVAEKGIHYMTKQKEMKGIRSKFLQANEFRLFFTIF